jgi:2-amino-4-hydroxy-6-hydroxymethyldihydropteridine diphosphokinase
MKLKKLIVSLGSNTPEGESNMRMAQLHIESLADTARFSPIYETEPVGQHRHARYKNCVAIVESTIPAEMWMVDFKQLERSAGRNEETRLRGDVPLDLDIVVSDGEVLRPKDFEQDYFKKGLELIGN